MSRQRLNKGGPATIIWRILNDLANSLVFNGADILLTIVQVLGLLAHWLGTTDGTNITMALICGIAMCGVPTRLVLFATLYVHLALLFI